MTVDRHSGGDRGGQELFGSIRFWRLVLLIEVFPRLEITIYSGALWRFDLDDFLLIMPSPVSPPTLLPPTTPENVLALQFSSWYPRFSTHSIKSTIVRPLSQEFLDYLNADGVFMPEGADDV